MDIWGLDTWSFSHIALISLSGQRNWSTAVPVFALCLSRPQAKVEELCTCDINKCSEI